MESVLTVFGVAVVGGVFAFATKIISDYREDVKFYRDNNLETLKDLSGAVGNLQATVNELKETVRDVLKDRSSDDGSPRS